MIREELYALVDARYDQFQALKQQPDFMAYEQQFARILADLGKDILQTSVGPDPENPRKKTPVRPDSAR